MRQVENKKIVIMFCAFVMIFLVTSNYVSSTTVVINGKVVECTACHTTGQSDVIAKNTINNAACYKCHRSDIEFSIPISKEVHIYHEGDISILPDLDYMKRHKSTRFIESEDRWVRENTSDCSACHVAFAGDDPMDCTKCHVAGNHVNNHDNFYCESCHGFTNDLFKHSPIDLVTHDVFGEDSCLMCHSPDLIQLELANGNLVPITKPSGLCKQCHLEVYNGWSEGNHHSNEECTTCHNPHSPLVDA